MDAEEVPVTGGRDGAGFLVLVLEVHEDLHLDAARVAGANRGDRVGPHEEAAVADRPGPGRHVHPLEFGDEVLVLSGRAQEAGGLAGGDDLVVLDLEGVGGAVGVDPAGQVLAVEHGHEAVVLLVFGRRRQTGQGEQQQSDRRESFHRGSSVVSSLIRSNACKR